MKQVTDPIFLYTTQGFRFQGVCLITKSTVLYQLGTHVWAASSGVRFGVQVQNHSLDLIWPMLLTSDLVR